MTSMAKSSPIVAGASTARRASVEIKLEYRPLWRIAGALIGRRRGVAFLDSGGDSAAARCSILGWNPGRVMAWPQGRSGALEGLRSCFDQTRVARPPGSVLPFHGGWMGWFSYDLGRHFERLPSMAAADPSIPDFVVGEYDMVLAEDHAGGELYVAGRCDSTADEAELVARAERIIELADRVQPNDPSGAPDGASGAGRAPHRHPGSPAALMSRADYRRGVETILEHIRDGDIYQANFSHRFSVRSKALSGDLYQRLRRESPAPFACYFDLPGGPEILSASPEMFLHRVGDRLHTRPIKGTRPRGADAAGDARLREELEHSEKERAELLMITDLLRNDLGRVAEYGSVRVEQLRALESHPTVHHAYSAIRATLRQGVGAADVLAATMPGGSITGAPKIRAMEILERLEPVRRGPYTGAAGYIGDDGDMCLNILIRTLVRQGEEIWYQVGGGIVADSDPDAEYQETLDKGVALRRALAGVGCG